MLIQLVMAAIPNKPAVFRMTPNPDFKVTLLLHAEYFRNGTRYMYRYSYNIVIYTGTRYIHHNMIESNKQKE